MSEMSPNEQQAREYLSALGLIFRIDGVRFDLRVWAELCRLAHNVIGCVTFSEPIQAGPWLQIEAHCNGPDKGGWITGRQLVTPPFWIRKVDLPRLQELEDFLALACC